MQYAIEVEVTRRQYISPVNSCWIRDRQPLSSHAIETVRRTRQDSLLLAGLASCSKSAAEPCCRSQYPYGLSVSSTSTLSGGTAHADADRRQCEDIWSRCSKPGMGSACPNTVPWRYWTVPELQLRTPNAGSSDPSPLESKFCVANSRSPGAFWAQPTSRGYTVLTKDGASRPGRYECVQLSQSVS